MYHASHLFSLFFSLSLSLTLPIVQSNLSMLMCVGLLTIIWTVLVPQSALPIHIHTVVLRTLESYAYGYYMDCVLLFSGAILCFFPSGLEYNSMGILRLDRHYSLGNNSYIAWHECCIFKNKCFVYLFIFFITQRYFVLVLATLKYKIIVVRISVLFCVIGQKTLLYPLC